MKTTDTYFGILVSDLASFWTFPVYETGERFIELTNETDDLDYLVPDSGEGGYVVCFGTQTAEQAAQALCETLAGFLEPSSAMMNCLMRSVHAYTFEWDDEEATLEMIQKA